MDEKHLLRVRLRAAVEAVPPRRRALEEELVAGLVQAAPAWQAAQTVLLYRNKGKEFSVVALANAAFRTGRRVCFPRVADHDGHLTLHAVAGWGELVPGAFGIAEPPPHAPVVDPAEVEFAVVPGLGFDDDAYRLGQGGGYYDRLLPGLGGPAWGVGFDVQRVARVPREAHDVPLDRVVSARDAQDAQGT